MCSQRAKVRDGAVVPQAKVCARPPRLRVGTRHHRDGVRGPRDAVRRPRLQITLDRPEQLQQPFRVRPARCWRPKRRHDGTTTCKYVSTSTDGRWGGVDGRACGNGRGGADGRACGNGRGRRRGLDGRMTGHARRTAYMRERPRRRTSSTSAHVVGTAGSASARVAAAQAAAAPPAPPRPAQSCSRGAVALTTAAAAARTASTSERASLLSLIVPFAGSGPHGEHTAAEAEAERG